VRQCAGGGTRAPNHNREMKTVGTETRKRIRSRLAHVEEGGRTYFLTFSAIRGIKLSLPEREIVLASCRYGHPGQWFLHGVVVMPDHVHMLLTPQRVENCAGEGTRAPNREREEWMSLGEIVKGIKSVTTRRINQARGIKQGSVWMEEYYDRLVRDGEDFTVKLRYLSLNPVKRGLVKSPQEWDALWIMKSSVV